MVAARTWEDMGGRNLFSSGDRRRSEAAGEISGITGNRELVPPVAAAARHEACCPPTADNLLPPLQRRVRQRRSAGGKGVIIVPWRLGRALLGWPFWTTCLSLPVAPCAPWRMNGISGPRPRPIPPAQSLVSGLYALQQADDDVAMCVEACPGLGRHDAGGVVLFNDAWTFTWRGKIGPV